MVRCVCVFDSEEGQKAAMSVDRIDRSRDDHAFTVAVISNFCLLWSVHVTLVRDLY